MAEVFISYSRRNLDFVQTLAQHLTEKSKAPWFDQIKQPLGGIPPGSKWWEEITYGIENTDTFLFVASPASVTSPYCHAEIAYARLHSKRIVSALYCSEKSESETWAAIDAAIDAISDTAELPNSVTATTLNLKMLVRENWLELGAIQSVIFSNNIPIEQSLAQLIQALDLDMAWVRMHSQLRQAAHLWVSNNRSSGYLWSAERLKPLYEMIERRKPELDPLIRDFIEPEQTHLLREIEDINTSHQRRSTIGERLATIGDPRHGVGLRTDGLPDIEWCYVPGGHINIENHQFQVEPFYISKYPLTYVQFHAFLNTPNGFENPIWWDAFPQEMLFQEMNEQRTKIDNYPIDSVSWYQAIAFSRWLSSLMPLDGWPVLQENFKTPVAIRLPTEWEWKQAATGGNSENIYPWGSEWDNQRANIYKSGVGRTNAVGTYPHGVSSVGALDLVGNVSEWCLNNYDEPFEIDFALERKKSLRGGAFLNFQEHAHSSFRYNDRPDLRNYRVGFRLVCASPILG